jgi:hypothetical protein
LADVSDRSDRAAAELNTQGDGGAAERLSRLMPVKVNLRSREETARFFEGLELVEPGVVQVQKWRPEPGDGGPDKVSIFGGVALKG